MTLIDGNGGPPQADRTIVISGERIADIFPRATKPLPRGAATMNLKGHFVMPGLIDSHYHFMIGLRSKEAEEELRCFALIGGITTVRDVAGDAVALAELAKLAADGNVQSPRVYFSALMAGPSHLSGDLRVDQVSRGHKRGEAPWARAITPETDIAKAVSEAKATGATGIKIYTDLAPEIVAKITSEAHRQGLKVWSHASIYPGKTERRRPRRRRRHLLTATWSSRRQWPRCLNVMPAVTQCSITQPVSSGWRSGAGQQGVAADAPPASFPLIRCSARR